MNTCKQCNTPLFAKSGDRPWTTSRRTFCSRSCSVSYNNAHRNSIWNDEYRAILVKYYYDGGYRLVKQHLPEVDDLQIMHEATRLKLGRRPDWRKHRDFSHTVKKPPREDYMPLPEEIKEMCEQIRKEREEKLKRA